MLYDYLPTVSTFNISRLDPFYPITYLLVAAAILHSGRAELTTPGPPVSRTHPARFALLGLGLGGACLVVVGTNHPSTGVRVVYLVLALLICSMVVARFTQAIRAYEVVHGQLEFRSTHDELTGAVSRVLLQDRIGHALAQAERSGRKVAVLYIDLDRFKSINDTYGHDAGDELLVATTLRICGVLRPSDTLGRVGGDEFVLLCEDITASGAVAVAERVVEAVAEPTSLSTLALQVTASVGLSLSGDERCTVDQLLRDADTAMYDAKRRGGNTVGIYDHQLSEEHQRRREVEDALRDATATGELVLHYQPIVRPRDNSIAGFEALLRWRRPDGTLLPPAEFISIAEETGAIVPMGAWVLETACHKIASWTLDGIDEPSISINVSALQFRHGALIRDLKRSLTRTGADPARLVLEITESALVRDKDDVIEQLDKVRQLGVRVAIDDFGTGYSGLSYLHRLPIDIIKFDRSLTSELDTDPAAGIVLGALIELARSLGLQVVAEGAETEEQIERLRALNCGLIQGYYFARPVTATMADNLARNGLAAARSERDITRL